MNTEMTVTPLPARRVTEKRKYPVCTIEKAMAMIEKQCGDVGIAERHGKGKHKVLVLPEATQELKTMISYGRRSPMNQKEQKYVGYGHILVDVSKRAYVLVVKHYIEIQTMNRTTVGASNLGPNGEYNPGLDFLEYHREEFLKMEAKYNTDAYGYVVDPFMRLCKNSEFVTEGHTHPDLGVFFSGQDRVSGAARAATSPICIFVCDPVRKTMLGAIGKDFEAAEVIVYERFQASEMMDESTFLETPADEIARLASTCLRTHGFDGVMQIYPKLDGRMCMKLRLVVPKAMHVREENSRFEDNWQ